MREKCQCKNVNADEPTELRANRTFVSASLLSKHNILIFTKITCIVLKIYHLNIIRDIGVFDMFPCKQHKSAGIIPSIKRKTL